MEDLGSGARMVPWIRKRGSRSLEDKDQDKDKGKDKNKDKGKDKEKSRTVTTS